MHDQQHIENCENTTTRYVGLIRVQYMDQCCQSIKRPERCGPHTERYKQCVIKGCHSVRVLTNTCLATMVRGMCGLGNVMGHTGCFRIMDFSLVWFITTRFLFYMKWNDWIHTVWILPCYIWRALNRLIMFQNPIRYLSSSTCKFQGLIQ